MPPGDGPKWVVHDLDELRSLPVPALGADRRRAVRGRAGEAFEAQHRGRVRALAVARVAFAVVLTGATAGYLLWAICVARTFG